MKRRNERAVEICKAISSAHHWGDEFQDAYGAVHELANERDDLQTQRDKLRDAAQTAHDALGARDPAAVARARVLLREALR